MENGNAAKLASYLVRLFYEDGQIRKSKYYTKDMVCAAPDVTGRYNVKISRLSCRVCLDRHDAWFLTGECRISYRIGNDNEKSAASKYSMLLQKKAEGICLTALHISENHGKEFCLTDVWERTHYLQETDILYLESGHNRTYWHTGQKTIEVTGYLQHVETGLPDSFVRIHKSYIVNVLHVEKIERCQLEMSNGEILQIPVKKYTEVRKEIKEKSGGHNGAWGNEASQKH